jgi:molybdate transport system permease protein
MMSGDTPTSPARSPRSDRPFFLALSVLGGTYIVLIVSLLVADASFVSPGQVASALASPPIRYAVWLSLISCTVTAILSLLVAVPLGYLLSRLRFTGKGMVDAVLDIPIVLPPMVIGLSLLIFFHTPPGQAVEALARKQLPSAISFTILRVLLPLAGALNVLLVFRGLAAALKVRPARALEWTAGLLVFLTLAYWVPLTLLARSVEAGAREKFSGITYEVPSVILAQFAVACAFAVRTMRVTFDDITPRREQVALTLGCGRAQAFWRVALPEARRGMVTAATLAWARALGEFGPILVFSGTTRMKTEVLSTTVFLEWSNGNLRAAVAVSLLMVLVALIVLLIVRVYGMEKSAA